MRKRRTMGILYLAAAVWLLGAAALAQFDAPQLRISNDVVEASLPTNAAPELSRVEASDSLTAPLWIPLARGQGTNWSTVFPDAREIVARPGGPAVLDEVRPDGRFYRTTRSSGPALTDEQLASRFLQQATFGPTRAAISNLVAGGLNYAAWIDAEIAKPPRYLLDILADIPALEDVGWKQVQANTWYHAAIQAPDQLRQRMAWALSQILVTSANGVSSTSQYRDFLTYYDYMVEHALGNYRDLIEDVTYSPLMGEFLTYDGNAKASGAQKPDENYAREVMQLFTIGLWELNPDGTLERNANGDPIPTYDNSHIETFARVFTGLKNAGDRIQPMVAVESKHDTAAKVLLDGVTTLPAGQTVAQDIDGALDFLFNHPNTGPFISRLLIQRLTGSNPSPGYIGRVAAVFNDNGSGVRGDLAAVARAILLDDEARDIVYTGDDAAGRLREPLERFIHLCRSFSLYSLRAGGAFQISHYATDPGRQPFPQYPFEAPSVFNFYLPDHQPYGVVTDRNLYAPEFELMNDSTTITFMNSLLTLVTDGLVRPLNDKAVSNPQGKLDLAYEIGLAGDVPALVDHLETILTAGRLTDANRQTIIDAVELVPAGDPEDRVIRALRLFLAAPEFNVLY